MKICAVIMAGGHGERFWPKSRNNMPKQFLSLTDDNETMIQKTVARVRNIVDNNDVYIITNKNYVNIVKDQIPELPSENILAEPYSKNTAPCIAYATAVIAKKYEDAVMIVLPSDHLIRYEDMFVDTVKRAADVAKDSNNLITIGIMPTHPETGYGYIKFIRDEQSGRDFVYKVERFVEKPELELAKEYISSGKYLWNSGVFIWKVSSVLESFKKFMPEIYSFYEKIKSCINSEKESMVINECYHYIEPVSIDFGIMEQAENIYTIPGNFSWDDVGSWLAMERINRTNELGNIVNGDVITISTKNSIIIGNKKLVAVVGMKNVVIVDTDDAMLVCSKENTHDIKKVIENLKICNREALI